MTQRKQKNKPWSKFRFGRSIGTRGEPKKRILIICEGEKTEPNYFKAFRVTSAVVVVIGLGTDTKRLVSEAISLRDKAVRDKEVYDQVWCVFDRDSFKAKDFTDAFKLAGKHKIKIAYSNEAFELWYLLHFHYFNTAVSRKLYNEKLSKLLGKEYRKNSKTIYDELLAKQNNAIKYSKKLLQSYTSPNPEKDNPSTTVYKLVEELNKNL